MREPVRSGAIRALPGRRSTGLLGLASTAAILGGALMTAVPYRGWAGESYSPFNHFASELGEVARSQAAAAFNLGSSSAASDSGSS